MSVKLINAALSSSLVCERFGKGLFNTHHVIGSIATLARHLLVIDVNRWRFNKLGQKGAPYLFFDHVPHPKIFLIFPGTRYESICIAIDLVIGDRIARCHRKIHALINILNDTIKGLL